jgi:ATP-dependent Clp protease ATP-binding subunit ClpA
MDKAAVNKQGGNHMPVIEYTPRMRRVLEQSKEIAESFGHQHIGTEHMLLALIASERGIAAQVLDQLGVTEEAKIRLTNIIQSPGYLQTSNKAMDVNGNIVGYLELNEDGTARLVRESAP